jgi:hypothetical protein
MIYKRDRERILGESCPLKMNGTKPQQANKVCKAGILNRVTDVTLHFIYVLLLFGQGCCQKIYFLNSLNVPRTLKRLETTDNNFLICVH